MLDRTTPPPIHAMGDLKLPKPDISVLSNGITLYSLHGGSQDVNQLSILWQGGSLEARVPAVAKIMTAVMREGTFDMTGTEISEALDFNGAIFKLNPDAHVTIMNVGVLNSKTVNVLPILRSIIVEPSFPENMFLHYRDREVKEFLLNQSRVSTLCHDMLRVLIKGRENPGAHIDSVDEIENITLDEVKALYHRIFTADGCKAYLSGNITPEIYQEVKTMLESLPITVKAVKPDLVSFTPEPAQTQILQRPDFVQAAVEMGLPAPLRSHPDYVPLRFTVVALGGYFGSRLMKNIREDKGLTYGIVAYLMGTFEGSAIVISSQTDSEYVEVLIDEVKKELERMATDEFSHDEMLRLKQFMSSSLMETLDSPFSIMDYYKTTASVGIPEDYFDNQVYWTHHITPEVIRDMAHKYLDVNDLRIAICE